MINIDKLTLHGYQFEAPEYVNKYKTKFLDKFCDKHNIDLHDVLANAGKFTVYSAYYQGSFVNTLVHYRGEKEESILLHHNTESMERTFNKPA